MDHLESLPVTWADVLHVLNENDDSERVVLPSSPVHCYSTVLSIAHQTASERKGASADLEDWWDAGGPHGDVIAEAYTLLQELLSRAHPASLEMDPIDALELMATDAHAVYAPLVFGYCPYSRTGYRDLPVTFHSAPVMGDVGVGTLLGGVGLAISARSDQPDVAAAFVRLTTSAEFQRGPYVAAGGQPGRLSAWTDPDANLINRNFFTQTLPTLTAAFMRPRLPGYPRYQKAVATALHQSLVSGSGATEAAAAMRRLWCEVMP